MKKLIVALVILLASCTSMGIYKVRTRGEFVGVAISTNRLLTIIHPPFIGQKVNVVIRGVEVEAEVIRIGSNGLVVLKGTNGSLDLIHGDSGSPAYLIIGRKPN